MRAALQPSLPANAWWRHRGLWSVAMVLGLLLLYLPALQSGFIWDDDEHLTANPCIIGPQGVWDLWTTRAARICPLVLTTFWLEHQLWGLAPLPYHLVNVLMHGGAALLLWRVLLRLKLPGAGLGAVLWAVHPVQVETVAWVTELKNTQSGLFFLAAILCYLRELQTQQREGRAGWAYGLTLVFGLLGMASKTSVVILPAVLGLLVWFWEGTISRRRWIQLLPLVLMAAAAAALALWTQHLEGANEAQWSRTLAERLVTAGAVVWFYLGKLLWPHPLVFVYPKWQVDATDPWWWLPLLLLLGVMGWLFWSAQTRPLARRVLVGALYFVMALGPVLGLLDHYFLRYSFVGDHFQYLASMGPLAGLGALLARCSARFAAFKAVVGGLLVVLAALTWHQQRLYRSNEALWEHTLSYDPTCWLACNNLGIIRFQEGQIEEAITLWEQAIRTVPNSPRTHTNLALARLRQGRIEEGLAHYAESIRLDPDHANARYNYGTALIQTGQVKEGLAQLEKAAQLDPLRADIHGNLGAARLSQGDVRGAVEAFETSLRLEPNDLNALSNLAWLRATLPEAALRDGQRAVELMQRVLTLMPEPALQTWRTLAAAQAETGDFEAALATAGRALEAAQQRGEQGMASALAAEMAAYRQRKPIRYATSP